MAGSPVVLCVAGHDPTGGAGLAMDRRVCSALGAGSATVVAVETLQDERGLHSATPANPAVVAGEMHAALASGDIAAVKTGALGSVEAVHAVAGALRQHPAIPLVVDPVFAASRAAHPGARLLEEAALPALRAELLPRAQVATPNLAEASWLSGLPVSDYASMARAAERILHCGAEAVLLTGGHLREDQELVDLLQLRATDPEWLPGKRLAGGGELRGTGCALSTAIAVFLARGIGPAEAVVAARKEHAKWMAAALAQRRGTPFLA